MTLFAEGQEDELARSERTNPPAGAGWRHRPRPGVLAAGIVERRDDYCATAYVYCRDPQPVPRLDVTAMLADIARRPYEMAHPLEAFLTEG